MTYKEFPVSIYDSLLKEKVKFETAVPGYVGMYVCGPTVYSDVHLGNVRTFLSFDLVFRYLKFLGYKVRYVRNITDVGHLQNDEDSGEDKIANKAKLENLEPMEIVQKYTNGFHDVMKMFNIQPPSIEPSATGHILEQIEMVQDILDAGLAYEANGSVYFDVNKYHKSHDYGRLSGRKIEDLYSNTRTLDGQEEKRNPLDFAIWKKAEESHIMRWRSPWSEGFPGWHLECSVMSNKYLGEQFDIHGGGMDLKFPHHECEIAQNKAALGKDSVRHWMHTNMLTVNGKKMSKSDGNGFTTLELLTGNNPLLEQAYTPMTVRFFMLQAHYGSTLDFSNEALKAAEKGYKRLMKSVENLRQLKYDQGSDLDKELDQSILAECEKVFECLSDDFNSARALSHLFELGSKINAFKEGQLNASNLAQETFDNLESTFHSVIVEVLGLEEEKTQDNNHLDAAMQVILRIRHEAKVKKNFSLSDQIRDELLAAGIKVMDGKDGQASYSVE